MSERHPNEPYRYGRSDHDRRWSDPPPLRLDDKVAAGAIVLLCRGVWFLGRRLLLPLMATMCVLMLWSIPWWGNLYLVPVNLATAYLFYRGRASIARGATPRRPFVLHALTLLGGAPAAEICRRTWCDRNAIRTFRRTIFAGCLIFFWAAGQMHALAYHAAPDHPPAGSHVDIPQGRTPSQPWGRPIAMA